MRTTFDGLIDCAISGSVIDCIVHAHVANANLFMRKGYIIERRNLPTAWLWGKVSPAG